ncbi:MAG: hypothetical protein Pg6C_03500 [Treponemataceae bacterium]|nr:MAG: hypothetical protein Pg6C_03500 [Treponemataceae bacterium]
MLFSDTDMREPDNGRKPENTGRNTGKRGKRSAKSPYSAGYEAGLKERDVILQIRYAAFEIKKPQIKNTNKELPPSLKANVIHVTEESPPEGVEPIEWFLMANEEVTGAEEAEAVRGTQSDNGERGDPGSVPAGARGGNGTDYHAGQRIGVCGVPGN